MTFQKKIESPTGALRTTDISLVTPCLIIIAGTGGDLSEGENGGVDADSRTTYESPAEGGESFMVEVEGSWAMLGA